MANPIAGSRLWMLAQQAAGNMPPPDRARSWLHGLPDPRLMPPIRTLDVDPNSAAQPAPMEIQPNPRFPWMPAAYR